MSDTDSIITALTEAPRSTAKELGVTNAIMKALEESGQVINVGNRSTGKRGKPPIEWAVAGSSIPEATKTRPGLPNLPEVTPEVRAALIINPAIRNDADVLAYIERQFAQGTRDDKDYAQMAKDYKRIVKGASNRIGKQVDFNIEDED